MCLIEECDHRVDPENLIRIMPAEGRELHIIKGYPQKQGSFFFGEFIMKALILVNGELRQPGALRRRIRAGSFDMVLGADWGARHARTLGVTLQAIIGDLDSLPDEERQTFGPIEYITFPAEKNETDLELALLYAIQKGARHIVLVGVLGGRLDMTVANILMMNLPALAACRIEAWHGNQTAWLIRPPGEALQGTIGDTISLIPLTHIATGICLSGFKYPLNQESLLFGQGRGLSNQIRNVPAHVDFAAGLLLAVHTPGVSLGKRTKDTTG
jgi:thiamine pyrophosphokinase